MIVLIIAQRSVGNVPVIKLLLRRSQSNDDNIPISVGIVPVIGFDLRLSVSNDALPK